MSAYAGLLNNLLFKNLYNFDLEHWNLRKHKTETYYQFMQRINNSNIRTTKNSASWDLSLEGSQYFNDISKSSDSTYYFSYSTTAYGNIGQHKPKSNMNYYLKPASRLIGSDPSPPKLSWYENDGIVNTIAMDSPHDEKIIQYDGSAIPGVVHMGKIEHDHHQILLRKLDDYGELIFSIYI